MADGRGPAVVHCSAGVGRTGTLLALDIGIQSLLQGETKLDILRIVSTLRQDRPGMIQTKDQYRYIHQVIHCYLTIDTAAVLSRAIYYKHVTFSLAVGSV